ncbi:peroxisomal membrane protein PEX14-like isoform X2 [Andrographis paniculata]|uniref:peroxisomal membrane protein PEX14-like isoform X2 n=1 Tax=Andrographis paniculata TaxID=175694 RepID=UPI0021E99D55|nr:peroxisomal membrane protein PEX14-like isoform X2 [Andrographis paniculata]
MSSPSDDPPSKTPQNPVSQVAQANDDRQDPKVEMEKEISSASVFVNAEPPREEQVQNAVRFLSHPKVRGSPVVYRRSFLERKGLTKEEIDEAFRRVPDSNPDATTTLSAVGKQDGQIKSSLNDQQQHPVQVLQSTPVGPAVSTSKVGAISRFRWYHGILAAGFLTVAQVIAAVVFKRLFVPKLKSWIRWIVLEEDVKGQTKKFDTKPSIAEEAAAAAKSAATAAADVARTSQDMLMTNSEEKRCLEELISMLRVQASEMTSLRGAIQKLEVGHSITSRQSTEEHNIKGFSWTTSGPYANGKVDSDSRSVRSLSPPVSVEPSVAPHPKSYMEIMAMIQRGEKPSNIREINDAPPNPNQPLPNPHLAPKPKPWEIGQGQSRSAGTFPSQASTNGFSIDDQLNGDNIVRWRQPNNTRTTETEIGNEPNFGFPSVATNETLLKRSWVPPQPPSVVMPEAAAAIRQPKKSLSQTDTETDDLKSADITDELQKITKISEMGGSFEANGSNSTHSNEIAPSTDERASSLMA